VVDQHSKKFIKHIIKTGCYFLSLGAIQQIKYCTVLDEKKINTIYKYCVQKGFILEDCEVKNPDGVLKAYAKFIDRADDKIYQVGVFDGSFTYWQWVKDESWNWCIVEHKTPGKYGSHFVLGDVNGNTIYDPLFGKGWKSKGINKIILYKNF